MSDTAAMSHAVHRSLRSLHFMDQLFYDMTLFYAVFDLSICMKYMEFTFYAACIPGPPLSTPLKFCSCKLYVVTGSLK